MKLSRRTLIRASALALTAPAASTLEGLIATPARAQAGAPAWKHGLSLFGDLKYPADFKHFEYVNPKAPRGGIVRLGIAPGTFDNFNQVVSGVKGNIVAGITMVFDRLMTSSLDEVSTEYGLLAESVSHPADFSSVTYRLRPEAKWHDGHAGDAGRRDLLARGLQEASPAIFLLLQARHQGGEDRRARNHLHLRSARQSRIAADRRPDHGAAEALVGSPGCAGQTARHFPDHARGAAWQRRLQDQELRARPQHHLRARAGLLGQCGKRECRHQQFRRDALRIFPRHHGRARGLQGRYVRLAHREQRQGLGHGL